MPPKTTQKEIVDYSKPTEQFRSLKFQVGGNFEKVSDTLNIFKEHFVWQSKHSAMLNSKYNQVFKYLLECYADGREVKVLNIEVQRAGFGVNEITYYDTVPRECMRLLVVVKERGFTSVDLILQGRNIPITIVDDGLYALPPQFSQLAINSGNTIGTRVKACKAIFINFTVECLSDIPRARVGNEFSRVEFDRGGHKAMDKIAEALDEQKREQIAKAFVDMTQGK